MVKVQMLPTRKTRICLEQRLSNVLSCRKISKFRMLAILCWHALARCPPGKSASKDVVELLALSRKTPPQG